MESSTESSDILSVSSHTHTCKEGYAARRHALCLFTIPFSIVSLVSTCMHMYTCKVHPQAQSPAICITDYECVPKRRIFVAQLYDAQSAHTWLDSIHADRHSIASIRLFCRPWANLAHICMSCTVNRLNISMPKISQLTFSHLDAACCESSLIRIHLFRARRLLSAFCIEWGCPRQFFFQFFHIRLCIF